MARFAAGNKAAVGRATPRPVPPAADYSALFAAECSPAAVQLIIRRAVVAAQNNDPRARAWLLGDRLLPDPAANDDAALVEEIAGLVAQWLPHEDHAQRFALAVVQARGLRAE
jgi:hypothetical protein